MVENTNTIIYKNFHVTKQNKYWYVSHISLEYFRCWFLFFLSNLNGFFMFAFAPHQKIFYYQKSKQNEEIKNAFFQKPMLFLKQICVIKNKDLCLYVFKGKLLQFRKLFRHLNVSQSPNGIICIQIFSILIHTISFIYICIHVYDKL